MMKPLSVIYSTGHGILHFMQSVPAAKARGVRVKVITGWVPSPGFPMKWVDRMGKLIGRKNLSAGLSRRRPKGLDSEEVYSCGRSEFLVQLLFKLSTFKLLKRDVSARWGWSAFGTQSKQFIRDADIFHVRSGAGHGGAIARARKMGMKIVVDHSIAHPVEMDSQLGKVQHRNGLEPDKYISTTPSGPFWQMVVEDCRQADVLLVNSDYVKDTFVGQGFSPDKIRVVHWGIDQSFYSLKNTYRIKGPVKLIFTGGFGSRKGGTLIINAVQRLMDQGIDFTLEIAGSITGDIPIPEWFMTSPRVIFHGHKPHSELKELLAAADIYIFPTYVEGSAQSVKEAMAVGLPVITTRQSGAPIEDGFSGCYIKDDDEQALADAIVHLAGNEALRTKMGIGAKETIAREHTWARYAESLLAEYHKVLS